MAVRTLFYDVHEHSTIECYANSEVITFVFVKGNTQLILNFDKETSIRIVKKLKTEINRLEVDNG